MDLPGWLLPHTGLTVALVGESAHGPVADDPVEVPGAMVQPLDRTVRDATGREVVSQHTAFLPAGTVCPTGSQVTWQGRTYSAVQVADRDGGGLGTPDHVEIALT